MTATVTPLHAERHAAEGLTGPELCVYAGITYRQLDFWTRAEYLHVTGGTAMPGSGYHRRYPQAEADVARVVRRLLDVGFTLQLALDYSRRVVQSGESIILADGLVRIDMAGAL